MTEAYTCRKLVVALLEKAGWDNEPHFFAEQRYFAANRTSRKDRPASISNSNNSKRPPDPIKESTVKHQLLRSGHGFGMRTNNTQRAGKWAKRVEEWLAGRGLLRKN